MRTTPMLSLALLTLGATLAIPTDAAASCYCMLRRQPTTQQRGIAEDPSYTPAAAVVLLRDGRRTVLTIEAAYEGPPVELSMVIPIPSAISREAVSTVSGTAFRRLDQRTAPRVRHVWPMCRPRSRRSLSPMAAEGGMGGGGRSEATRAMDEFGVDIQDEWPVDEYDVTLLGARESTGLLAFLRERGLALPDAAVAMLRGYIESDHRFVLVRADPSRAQRLGDAMMLSPIQIAYDSDQLTIPVRLGTLNSPGEQELLVYVLSTEGRYEIANRPSLEAPTDLRMRRDARGSFAELYTSITDELFRRTPGAAITEYAHLVGRHVRARDVAPFGVVSTSSSRPSRGVRADPARSWTITRIRHRYGTELSDDLTLRPAPPLRLTRRWRHPSLRTWVREGQSAFHVQYVVEHTGCTDEWTQRRVARRFATAESMWESRHDLWPGEVILDPITSLGIEPGSSAPAGWPPPPPPAQPPPIEATPTAALEGASNEPRAAANVEAPAAAPAAPRVTNPAAAPAPSTGGLCAVQSRGASSPAVLLALAAALGIVLRRRR